MNNFLILMLIVWGSAAIGTIFRKNENFFEFAFIFSILAGIGYFLLKTHG